MHEVQRSLLAVEEEASLPTLWVGRLLQLLGQREEHLYP